MNKPMQGIVYKMNGQFLKYTEATTHTGTHHHVTWIDNLQEATVLYAPLPYALRSTIEFATKLQATEHRTVYLLK